jgi:pimeloyl-ACP methyl ester carboxylesterase
MKLSNGFRAIAGILLCAGGLLYSLPTPYHERTFQIRASGCELITTVVEPSNGVAQGSVVLFHGLSANRKIMSYTARAFAEQGLRVYVPDLPGHGRTAGPFSPARAEECGEALLKDLLQHGSVIPDRTILAGHSMGAAIAMRVADRVAVKGVIAISPAPMRAAHGVRPEALLFTDPPQLPPNTLVISGGLESDTLRGNARELFDGSSSNGSKYQVIRGASHVSLLFDPRMARASQEWAASLLQLERTTVLPSRSMLLGCLAGFLGLLLIARPFLQEAIGKKKVEEQATKNVSSGFWRQLVEFAVICLGTVVILKYWNPFGAIHVFEADYLAGFLFFTGIVLLLLHRRAARETLKNTSAPIIGAAFASLVLLLLVSAWFDLTVNEAWVTASKWPRFPILFLAVFPYHLAEEMLLGPTSRWKSWQRLFAGLSVRLIGWLVMLVGLFLLHSGEILFLLLGLYLALFCALQRRGMDVVREGTGSAIAAAVFGAILLAGFCLVIFPIT